MALATRCPSCATVFQVSTAQATAKGGMVRCGQCRNAFDAFDALVRIEDLEPIDEPLFEARSGPPFDAPADPPTGIRSGPPVAAIVDASAEQPPEALQAPSLSAESHAQAPPESSSDSFLSESSSESSSNESSEAPSNEGVASGDPTPTASPHRVVVVDEIETTGSTRAPFDETPAHAAPGTVEPPARGAAGSGAVAALTQPSTSNEDGVPAHGIGESWPEAGETNRQAPIDEPVLSAATTPDPGGSDLAVTEQRTDLRGIGSMLGDARMTYMQPEAARSPMRRSVRWAFGLLSFAAACSLIGQALYVWRDEVAVGWSPSRPWLAAACVPLHCTVDYPKRLTSITIESAAIQTASAALNVYTLTALLRNRDAVAVRYPHLELVLTDVQDRPILRRALRPEEYLTSGQPSSSNGFAAESELPLRVMFELSDLRFAGYRLEKFYP